MVDFSMPPTKITNGSLAVAALPGCSISGPPIGYSIPYMKKVIFGLRYV